GKDGDGRGHSQLRNPCRRPSGRDDPFCVPGAAGPGARPEHRAVGGVRRSGCAVRGAGPARGARPGADRSPPSAVGLTVLSAVSVGAGPVAGLATSGVVSRPGLFERLGAAPRVMVVSAPPGSGKTVLVRSWIDDAGLAERAGGVAGQDARDPQRFWLSVVRALRRTPPGAALVRGVGSGAPWSRCPWGPPGPGGSFGPPATTCGWACTGCGWRASWPSSASPI